MGKTAKKLLWMGILVALILLVWAMLDQPVTLGGSAPDTNAEATADNTNFSSELSGFDRSADSIDFNSDFSTAEIDAAMNAQ